MRRWLRGGCGGLVVVVLAGVFLSWFLARPARPHAWFQGAPFLLMAHQGGECEWPSNTLEAFRQSDRLGVDVLDMDLHLSADGQLVLLHDTTVDRTTDGHGAVRELTWRQLSGLDAGYRFTRDGKTYPYRGRGLRIPRLEEVLKAFPHRRLGIEVKEAPLEAATRLAEVLRAFDCQDRVLLSCFDEAMMKELRRLCPGAASSASPSEVRRFVLASRLHLEDLLSPDYQALQIPLEKSGWQLVTPRTVAAAHRRGLKVLPWTIDTPEEAMLCRQAGVDGLNTNWPSRMKSQLQSWRLR